MADEKMVQKVVEKTDLFLNSKNKYHERMLQKSIRNLEGKIDFLRTKLAFTDSEEMKSLKVNLAQLQEIHLKLEQSFQEEEEKQRRYFSKSYKDIEDNIDNNFSILKETAAKFTSVDKDMLKVLKQGLHNSFSEMFGKSKNKVVQAFYDNVVAGSSFQNLSSAIKEAIDNTDLKKYHKMYANDMIMNYHNEVNMVKASKTKLNHFLYVGNVINTSRQFCIERAGRVFTKEEIQSWNFKWAGKSGPAFTHRGGYNCRHHWQAVNPKWLKNKDKVDIQNWHLTNKEEELPRAKPKSTPTPVVKETKEFTDIIQNIKKETQIDLNFIGYDNNVEKIKLAKIVDKEYKRIKKLFPEVNFKEIKTYMEIENKVQLTEGVNPFGIKVPIKGGPLGYSWGKNIGLGGKTIDFPNQFTLGKNFIVSSDFASVFRHEFAHRIHKYIATQAWGTVQKEINEDILSVYLKNKDKIPGILSTYGNWNHKEFFAELFTAVTNPKYKKGMLPVEMEDLVFGLKDSRKIKNYKNLKSVVKSKDYFSKIQASKSISKEFIADQISYVANKKGKDKLTTYMDLMKKESKLDIVFEGFDDTDKIKEKAAQIIYEEMEKFKKYFPKIDFKKIKTRMAIDNKIRLDSYLVGKTKRKKYNKGALGLSHKEYITLAGNEEILNRTDQFALGKKFSVSSEISSVFRHEYAHRMHNHFYESAFGSFEDEMNKKITETFQKYKGKLERILSKYAEKNEREFFAEYIASITNSQYKKGMLPADIENLMKDFMED